MSQERVRSFGRVGLRFADLQGDFDLVWISSLRVLLLTQGMIKRKFDKNKHIFVEAPALNLKANQETARQTIEKMT